jgi:hypothetical protein
LKQYVDRPSPPGRWYTAKLGATANSAITAFMKNAG